MWSAAIKIAQKQVSTGNIKFFLVDAQFLPFSNAFADVYISLETIEVIKDDKLFLAEVKRVLKPNGIFICSTPNRLISNPGNTLTGKPWNKYHIREYSPSEFLNLLKLNFNQIDLYGQNGQAYWKMKFLTFSGKYLPAHAAVRISQLFKFPRLIYPQKCVKMVFCLRKTL